MTSAQPSAAGNGCVLEMALNGGIAGAAIQFDYFQIALADWALRNCLIHSASWMYIIDENKLVLNNIEV